MNKVITKQRHGKIDNEVLVKAIVEGKTQAEAGMLAGSKGISEKVVANNVSEKIKNNPVLKNNIIKQLEEKRQIILDSLTKEELNKAPIQVKLTGIGILTDKIVVLEGSPFSTPDQIPKMYVDKNIVVFNTYTVPKPDKLPYRQGK